MNRNELTTTTEKHIKVGRGQVVHMLATNGQRAACGAGDIGVGSRRRSSFQITNHPVTCKKCLAKMAEIATAS